MENNLDPLKDTLDETILNPETESPESSLDETVPEITQSPLPLEINPAEPKKNDAISIKISLNKRKTIIGIAIVAGIAAVGVIIYALLGFFVAATVGWSPISRYAVISELETVYGKTTLNSLITQKLIDVEAEKKGIIVGDEEVNAEITKIEAQISAQGQTLEAVLKTEGMTMDDLKTQIVDRKKMEKLVADKTVVEAAEVEQYIKDYKITIPKGQEVTYREQLKEQLESQKLNEAASALLETLKAQSKIRYFGSYSK
jgi:foldase protein PrsA